MHIKRKHLVGSCCNVVCTVAGCQQPPGRPVGIPKRAAGSISTHVAEEQNSQKQHPARAHERVRGRINLEAIPHIKRSARKFRRT